MAWTPPAASPRPERVGWWASHLTASSAKVVSIQPLTKEARHANRYDVRRGHRRLSSTALGRARDRRDPQPQAERAVQRLHRPTPARAHRWRIAAARHYWGRTFMALATMGRALARLEVHKRDRQQGRLCRRGRDLAGPRSRSRCVARAGQDRPAASRPDGASSPLNWYERTARVNALRGLLYEFGVVMPRDGGLGLRWLTIALRSSSDCPSGCSACAAATRHVAPAR